MRSSKYDARMWVPRTAKLSCAIAAALLMTACVNLAPDYQRPALPVPASLPSAAAGPTIAQPAWRDLVRDERLRTVVDKALVANRDLRVALLNVERSRAQLQISNADRWPTLSAGLTGSRSPNSNGDQTTVLQAGLQLSSYEIDVFERLRNTSVAAQATLLGNEAAGRSARLSLVTQTVGTWLTLAADEEQLALARRTLATREQTEELTSLRARLGAASELELRTVQTLTAQSRSTLAQLQRQRAQDLNALNLLVGDSLPAADLPGQAAVADAGWLAEVPAGASSDLLLARPDVIQAEQGLIGANANIGAARAAMFPRLSLSGSFGQVSDTLSGLVNSGTTAWTLGASALLTVFDYGRNQANVRVSELNRDVAVAQYEKAVQTAFREAADGLQGQSEWRRQVLAQQDLLEAERVRNRLTRLRLEVGAAGLTDMLDAERSLAAAEQALVQARLGELLNRLALYKALGGEETRPAS